MLCAKLKTMNFAKTFRLFSTVVLFATFVATSFHHHALHRDGITAPAEECLLCAQAHGQGFSLSPDGGQGEPPAVFSAFIAPEPEASVSAPLSDILRSRAPPVS
jgi:hypothetical protein